TPPVVSAFPYTTLFRSGGAAVGNEQLAKGHADIVIDNQSMRLKDGSVVIAAITSCTNTSNQAVMLGAGLLARNAARLGLKVKPRSEEQRLNSSHVKISY